MSNEPGIPTIQSEYADKVAADLESNAKEQESVRSEIEALQIRLDRLQDDAKWLSGVQGTLVSVPAAPKPAADSPDTGEGRTAEGAAAAEAVPRPRRAKKAVGEQGTVPKKTAGTKPAGAAPSAGTAKPAKKTQPAGKKDGPPWRVFVMEVLQDGQPRTAGEIAEAITQAHPDRDPGEKVVRNTVNALIGKGDVGRDKQGNTVYYTALKKADESAADASAAVPEQAQEEPVPVDA